MDAARTSEPYLAKAEASLAGAESEFAGAHYDNCANRCYYACFQAAIAALAPAGVQPSTRDGQWGHALVQNQFAGQLISLRHLYPVALRGVLSEDLSLRGKADYDPAPVTRIQAQRARRRSRDFVRAGRVGGEAT